ncbi:unnamed protein product [Linum trigynum]|uniref:Uncharacterized protein n=1 Tax=Linum trigynum TaxID=586398 RepID=A0AAV2EY52_9ROSI
MNSTVNFVCFCYRDDGDIGTVVVMMKSSESSPPGTRSGSPGTGSEDSDRGDDSGHVLFKETSSRKRYRHAAM